MAKNCYCPVLDINCVAVGMGCCVFKSCSFAPRFESCSIVSEATMKLIFSTPSFNSYGCIKIFVQFDFAPVGVVAWVAYSTFFSNAYVELVVT